MTRILLIRHGQSAANVEGYFAGNMDVPLTQQGIEQARLTANFILQRYSVDHVYASDLSRAFTTGQMVAQGCGREVISDVRLREIRAGKWEGNSFDILQEAYSESYGIWLTDIGNAAPESGETVAQLQTRVVEAVYEIASRHIGETVVVSTHATPIRALQCYCEGKPLDRMKEVPWVSNASVTEVFFDGQRLTLGKIAMDAHLGDRISRFPANV